MEALSASLQPHKEIIGSVASIVTIAQFFSGAFIIKDIYKKGTTKGVSSLPFIGGIVIGILMLKYAALLNDPAMLQVNVSAIFLNIIYMAFYYAFSSNKQEEIFKPVSFGVLLTAIFLGYAQWENTELIENRYGLLVTILMLLLLGSPLKDVKEILDKKDASSIPFPMTFMGAIVSFLWFLYGVILLNSFMVVQNVLGITLCLLQLVLIFKYPGNSTIPAKSQKKPAKLD